jgi:GNAT superfamily N-acetyltransferase
VKQNLTDYLRSTALEDDKNNIAKVWVFVIEKEVIGYIDNEPIIKTCISTGVGKLATRDNVPGILISEMAGHIDYAGRGLGRLMVAWVVSKALDLSQYAAIIIVESLEDKVGVYKHWGFQPIDNFEEKRYTMYLRIA